MLVIIESNVFEKVLLQFIFSQCNGICNWAVKSIVRNIQYGKDKFLNDISARIERIKARTLEIQMMLWKKRKVKVTEKESLEGNACGLFPDLRIIKIKEYREFRIMQMSALAFFHYLARVIFDLHCALCVFGRMECEEKSEWNAVFRRRVSDCGSWRLSIESNFVFGRECRLGCHYHISVPRVLTSLCQAFPDGCWALMYLRRDVFR